MYCWGSGVQVDKVKNSVQGLTLSFLSTFHSPSGFEGQTAVSTRSGPGLAPRCTVATSYFLFAFKVF